MLEMLHVHFPGIIISNWSSSFFHLVCLILNVLIMYSSYYYGLCIRNFQRVISLQEFPGIHCLWENQSNLFFLWIIASLLLDVTVHNPVKEKFSFFKSHSHLHIYVYIKALLFYAKMKLLSMEIHFLKFQSNQFLCLAFFYSLTLSKTCCLIWKDQHQQVRSRCSSSLPPVPSCSCSWSPLLSPLSYPHAPLPDTSLHTESIIFFFPGYLKSISNLASIINQVLGLLISVWMNKIKILGLGALVGNIRAALASGLNSVHMCSFYV